MLILCSYYQQCAQLRHDPPSDGSRLFHLPHSVIVIIIVLVIILTLIVVVIIVVINTLVIILINAIVIIKSTCRLGSIRF